MSLDLSGTCGAMLIAFGFASLGNLVLARRASDIFDWNESFVVGVGFAAALLFPFSMSFRQHALMATIVLLMLAAVYEIARLFPALNRPISKAQAIGDRARLLFSSFTRLEWVWLALITASALAFFILNLSASLAWDGFQIWATKAQSLYLGGALGPEPVPETKYLGRVVNYPPLIPLYEALLTAFNFGLKGNFDFEAVKPVFPIFYLSLLISTYRAARVILPRVWSLGAVTLLAALPGISFKFENIGGYADMPLAAVVAAATAAGLRLKETVSEVDFALAWLLGAMLMVKNEGIVLLFVAVMTLAFAGLSAGAVEFRRRLSSVKAPMGTLIILVMLRMGYLKWIGYDDIVFVSLNGASVWRAFNRVWTVVVACLKDIFDITSWGFFWPLFFLLGGMILVKGRTAEKVIAFASIFGLLCYTGIYLFSNWEVELHIHNSFPRLLSHLAPAAAIAIVSGYRAFHGRLNSAA